MNETGRSEAGAEPGLRGQVELAQAAMVLSIVIAAAVLIANFGAEPAAIAEARASALAHRQLVAEHEKMLRDTEQALRQTEEALAQLRANRSATP